MKKLMISLSVAVFALAMMANIQYALDGYGVDNSNLHAQVLAQSTGTDGDYGTGTGTVQLIPGGANSICPKGGYVSKGVRARNDLSAYRFTGKKLNGVSFDFLSKTKTSAAFNITNCLELSISSVKAVEYTCDNSNNNYCVVCNMYRVL